MTPICNCEKPDVVTEPRKTFHGVEYNVTYCRKCGFHHDPQFGSRPAAPAPKPVNVDGCPKEKADRDYERDMSREHRRDSEFPNRGRSR